MVELLVDTFVLESVLVSFDGFLEGTSAFVLLPYEFKGVVDRDDILELDFCGMYDLDDVLELDLSGLDDLGVSWSDFE